MAVAITPTAKPGAAPGLALGERGFWSRAALATEPAAGSGTERGGRSAGWRDAGASAAVAIALAGKLRKVSDGRVRE
ncbi:hypothetical protein Aab01nite_47740 [Paractinoplanes abujensis]|nr:hypothetical protein Aab01nite_47740 [Actinoplanes abujensis]